MVSTTNSKWNCLVQHPGLCGHWPTTTDRLSYSCDFIIDVPSSVQHNAALLRRSAGCFATVFHVISPDKFACSIFMLTGNVSAQTAWEQCQAHRAQFFLYLFHCNVSFIKLTALFIHFGNQLND